MTSSGPNRPHPHSEFSATKRDPNFFAAQGVDYPRFANNSFAEIFTRAIWTTPLTMIEGFSGLFGGNRAPGGRMFPRILQIFTAADRARTAALGLAAVCAKLCASKRSANDVEAAFPRRRRRPRPTSSPASPRLWSASRRRRRRPDFAAADAFVWRADEARSPRSARVDRVELRCCAASTGCATR